MFQPPSSTSNNNNPAPPSSSSNSVYYQQQQQQQISGVIVPPPLSDTTGSLSQQFPAGIKGSIATEVQTFAKQDRLFFTQLRAARGKSHSLRSALVKKVKTYEMRYGSIEPVEKTLETVHMLPERKERLLTVLPSVLEIVAKVAEEQPALMSEINKTLSSEKESGQRRERDDEEDTNDGGEGNTSKNDNDSASNEASAKPPVPKNEAAATATVVTTSSSTTAATAKPPAAVPAWKARREAQQQQQQQQQAAAAAADGSNKTAPNPSLRSSKMFGLLKGVLGNAKKEQEANASVLKQRQQLQDRTEKEAMLTDIGSLFNDYSNTLPRLERLQTASEQAAKLRGESTWLYKMCILEDDNVALAHFLHATADEDDDDDENSNDNDDDAVAKQKQEEIRENADSEEDTNSENEDTQHQKSNNKESKYPPQIPNNAVLWLPAKHTPSSEQKLRSQLHQAVQRFESFTEEAKEFLLHQQVRRQAELQSKILQDDLDEERKQQAQKLQQQHSKIDGLLSAPSLMQQQKGNKGGDGKNSSSSALFSSPFEGDDDDMDDDDLEDDPTMML